MIKNERRLTQQAYDLLYEAGTKYPIASQAACDSRRRAAALLKRALDGDEPNESPTPNAIAALRVLHGWCVRFLIDDKHLIGSICKQADDVQFRCAIGIAEDVLAAASRRTPKLDS